MNLLANQYSVILLFGACVFTFAYLNSERILKFIWDRSIGNRQEVLRMMDMMMIETDKKKVTWTLLLLSFGLGSIVFLALWPSVLAGFILGSATTMAGWSIPSRVMKNIWEKRCSKIVNQMVDGLTMMANGVRAGLSITQTMERVVDNMAGPLPQEFNLVLNKVRLGMSVEEALSDFAERIPRADVQMFVTAINILKETGGNLPETFDTIVTTVRERQKVERRIEALTAQGRMQAIIMTLVPFIILVVFFFLDPNYVMPLFIKPLGWFALLIMLTLQVLGGILMKKIVTIKV